MDFAGRACFVKRAARRIVVAALAFALAACLSNVQSLGPNMVRLNMTGVQAPSEGLAINQVMTLAAQQTLARGYTLFRFIDWTAGQPTAATPGQPATANFSVTVVMFHDGEQGFYPVFSARQFVPATTQQ
jgi:hypothetical protein